MDRKPWPTGSPAFEWLIRLENWICQISDGFYESEYGCNATQVHFPLELPLKRVLKRFKSLHVRDSSLMHLMLVFLFVLLL